MTALAAALVLTIVFGVLICLRGADLYHVILKIVMFCAVLDFCLEHLGNGWLGWTAGVAGGIAAALLEKHIHKFSVFLTGAAGGYMLSQVLAPSLPADLPAVLVYGMTAALCILGGILTVKWKEFFLKASTAFCGGLLTVLPSMFLVKDYQNLAAYVDPQGIQASYHKAWDAMSGEFAGKQAVPVLVLTAVLTVIGYLSQRKSGEKKS